MQSIKRFLNLVRTAQKTPPDMPDLYTRPKKPIRGRVIFAAFEHGFNGRGKLYAGTFYPGFCAVLHAEGIATEFAESAESLARLVGPDSVTVHVYREDSAIPQLTSDSPIVFNAPEIGRLIVQKETTNKILTEVGIPVPRLIKDVDDVQGKTVFSNDPSSSGADTALEFRPAQYNTELIDTSVEYNGEEYYTTVRLLCVGSELLHCNVMTRRKSEKNPSVHAGNTPLDPGLIRHLYDVLITPRIDEFRRIARVIGERLGPGFYGHDLVVSRETGVAHVCEVGFKFDSRAYTLRLAPISSELPMLKIYTSGEFQRASAKAFLRECRALGAFQGEKAET